LLTLRHAAPALRLAHTYVWLYAGNTDRLKGDTLKFTAKLHRDRIPYRYLIFPGGHDWALWRAETPRALVVASKHLAAHG
jgi:enterochelin esterase-like enzyme